MELISHVICERDILKRIKKSSLENLASNQKRIFRIVKQRRGLRRAHAVYRRCLHRHVRCPSAGRCRAGGANRDRTGDLLLAKQALSQLSYGPIVGWWVWEELHPRPHPYQGCAL